MIKYYKKSILMIVIVFCNYLQSQTTLSAGDIAITGYVGNGTVTGTDQFSFVLLKNITSNTSIKFTDTAWLRTGPTTGSWRTTAEGIVTWTAQSALSVGTEVTITLGTPLATTTVFQGTSLTAGTVTGTALSFSANGDQVIAYQGTEASPTFITALHMNVYTSQIAGEPTTNETDWDGNYDTANASGIPTGLTSGVNAIWIGTQGDINSEFDNARFNCGTLDLSTVAKIKALIFNKANFTTSNNAPGFTLPSGCRYMDPALDNKQFDFEENISVFPNPFTDKISIVSVKTLKKIEIYTILGEKVLSDDFKYTLDMSHFSDGVYFVKLIDENNNHIIRKVVKNK